MSSSLPLLAGLPGPLQRIAGRLRRRHLLIPCIVAAHALVLTLIFLQPRSGEATLAITPPISVFDVRASAETPEVPTPPPEPARPPEPLPIVMPALDIPPTLQPLAIPAPPIFSASAAEQAGFGTTCDVADTLARAFAEDSFIKGELARIGPQSRSVSNAIMFWDAHWVELPGDAPKEAVDALRRGILEGVRAAPPACLAQEQAGPRFIFVSDTSSTLMLVIGSGVWRWEQLLVDAENTPDSSILAQQGVEN